MFDGGDDGRELAIKVFDRFRYPIDPARDIYIMANTWGSTATKQDAQNAAREENVLREKIGKIQPALTRRSPRTLYGRNANVSGA